MAKKKRCETCKYFDPYWEKGDPPPHTGDCERYPPVWIGNGRGYESPTNQDLWSVPHVGAFYCCGEWKKRKDKHERQ